MSEYAEIMKVIKWARKRGACLIKVGNVELTFPLDAGVPQREEQAVLRNTSRAASEDTKAEMALRSALSSDALNQIEDQEKWFHNNRPPEIL